MRVKVANRVLFAPTGSLANNVWKYRWSRYLPFILLFDRSNHHHRNIAINHLLVSYVSWSNVVVGTEVKDARYMTLGVIGRV